MTLPIETTNKVGAPEGNDNARKGKLFYDQLRRVLVQNDSLKLRQVSEKLVDAAIEGEPWAVKEVIDRMDGKAIAIQEIQGPDGTQLKAGFVLTFEEPSNGNDSGS
jgi:glycerol-3-phosphate cytidylyltransferase-like family protein